MPRKGESVKALGIGAFGKVPTQPDFFRHNAAYPEVGVLDRWLQEGLELAPQLLGERWREAYDGANPVRFVLRPADGPHCLVGVAVASGDAAGRRFPFSVFQVLDGDLEAGEWAEIPHVFASFLDAAERLGVAAARGDVVAAGAGEAGLGPEVDALSGAEGRRSDEPHESYQAFIHRVRCADLLGGLPSPSASKDPALALRGLREVLRSVATSSGRGGPSFGLRAVLPAELGRGSLELPASWWMDLTARALGGCGRPPVAFWTRTPAQAPESASGRLFLTPALPRFLGCWLDPDAENDRLWDLVPPATGGGTDPGADDEWTELSGSPLALLLEKVAAWSRS